MHDSVDKIVADYKKASRRFRRQIKADPAIAREFLIAAGIAEPRKDDPSRLQLTKKFRPSGE